MPAAGFPECMFGAHLVIVAQIYDELSHGQAEFPRILSQNVQNDLEGQGQWPSFSIPTESFPGCKFGENLVILAKIYDELSCIQADFPRILSQNGQNDLEGQGQWPLFSIPTVSIPWCKFGAKLVIPAQICDELSCGQGKVYGRTDRRTDRQTDWRRQRQRPRGNKTITSFHGNTFVIIKLHILNAISIREWNSSFVGIQH